MLGLDAERSALEESPAARLRPRARGNTAAPRAGDHPPTPRDRPGGIRGPARSPSRASFVGYPAHPVAILVRRPGALGTRGADRPTGPAAPRPRPAVPPPRARAAGALKARPRGAAPVARHRAAVAATDARAVAGAAARAGRAVGVQQGSASRNRPVGPLGRSGGSPALGLPVAAGDGLARTAALIACQDVKRLSTISAS